MATAVHFYEAVLATLAIVVWHFYHVVFDPEVYPVDLAFYDGKVSEDSTATSTGSTSSGCGSRRASAKTRPDIPTTYGGYNHTTTDGAAYE